MCILYGYTPHKVMRELSWGQVLMLHKNGMEYDLLRRGFQTKKQSEGPQGNPDEPDRDALYSKLGQYKRG